MKEEKLCEKCGLNPAQEPHQCPYQRDVKNNDDTTYCNCCVDCEHDCLLSV